MAMNSMNLPIDTSSIRFTCTRKPELRTVSETGQPRLDRREPSPAERSTRTPEQRRPPAAKHSSQIVPVTSSGRTRKPGR